MSILEYITNDFPASIIFDPIPSYDGEWSFKIEDLIRNAKRNDNENMFVKFIEKNYSEPLKRIFIKDKLIDNNIRIISRPNQNNIGRCLCFSKKEFMINMTIFLDYNIDSVGLNEEENNKRISDLLSNITKSNEDLNTTYATMLQEKARRLKDLITKEINSEYYESALNDYLPYKNQMDFKEYLNDMLEVTNNYQIGMLKLNDFFDKPLDYNELYNEFDPDKFFLLFAKIIYENNKLLEQIGKPFNKNIAYLLWYYNTLKKVLKKQKRYDVEIYYTLPNRKLIKYSCYEFIREFNLLLKNHPELKKEDIPIIQDENFKDINLMKKLSMLQDKDIQNRWEYVLNNKIEYNEEIDNLYQNKDDLKMRIEILEHSGFIGNILKGKDFFLGYYALIYASGIVIIEKIEGEINSTYVMNIDDFINLSKNINTAINNYIKVNKNIFVKRIFHTNINNWQRNLYNVINGNYSLKDALEYIKKLNLPVVSLESNSIYTILLNYLYNELEAFTTLLNADNNIGLNVSKEEIFNFLEFSNENNRFNSPLVGNILITEGDILSVLKIILELSNYIGEYILYINEDNVGTISYLCKRANKIYESLGLIVSINIDYNINYNNYIGEAVNVIGSETFIKEVSHDFESCNQLIV